MASQSGNITIFDDIDPDSNYFEYFETLDRDVSFLTVNQLNDCLEREGGLKILSYNIRSFSANYDSFCSMFDSSKSYPDIVSICETWFHGDTTQNIDGYVGHHVTRETTRSGGVSVYMKQHISSKLVQDLSFVNQTIEICTVHVEIHSLDLFLLSIYRPHHDSVENFIQCLEGILRSDILRNKSCILVGDFNINLLNEESCTKNFMYSMQSLHYVPLVSKPTRFPSIRGHSPTLIDHVWINDVSKSYFCRIVANDMTDHCPIYLNCFTGESYGSVESKIKIEFRSITEENKNKFEYLLGSFNWNELRSDDVDIYLENFMDRLNSFYCQSFPLKIKYVSQKCFEKPWLTRSLKELIKAKSKYFKLYRLNLLSREEINRFRNRVKSILNKNKNAFYREYFRRNQNNMKNSWKMIKTVANFSTKNKIWKSIFWNGIQFNSDTQISKAFNEYFTSIPETLAYNLPQSSIDPLSYLGPNHLSSFFLYPVCNECFRVIMNLKNTRENLDHISVGIFKLFSRYLVEIVCDLINLCFKNGVFPNTLKIARITPIHKKGDVNDISNYRPIAILPFMSKILERCISNRLFDFLDKNSILDKSQFGFRQGFSTADAVSALVEHLYDTLNLKLSAVNVFVDFSRAFDTVDREILVRKLELYGIRGIPLKLVSDYLSHRRQYVRINQTVSPMKTVNLGIGQGTILGPLLFLVYINDLPRFSENCKTILYADDSTFVFRGDNPEVLNELCNCEMGKFFDWSKSNRLSVNISKTVFNVVSNYSPNFSHNFQIYLNNVSLVRKDPLMFLGVFLDEKLKFIDHVAYISSKISKSIGFLYKLRGILPNSTLKFLYYAMVNSYLYYCNIVWARTFSTHLQPLRILQKKAIRVINNAPFLAHTISFFVEDRILKFDDINVFQLAVFMFKNFDLPIFRRNYQYNTRNVNAHRSMFQRLGLTQHSIYYGGPIVFNSLPTNLKSVERLETFKAYLKTYLIGEYVLEDE